MLILLIIFVLSTIVNITDFAFESPRDDVKQAVDQLTVIGKGISMHSDFSMDFKEYMNIQMNDEFTFDRYVFYIMNLEILFYKLSIIPSFYQLLLYIKGWIILTYQFKIKFFVMRYLELKDGKKDALSLQFSF